MNENEENITKTYGVTEGGDTSTYGSVDSNNTSTYGNSESSNTGTYSDISIKSIKSQTHDLGNGDKITLKDVEYEIIGIISEGTGEAVIYKIKDVNNSVFVLKLYFEFEKQNEEPNFETLARIKELNNPDILKLIDYGKYQYKYCYEISEFAKGGDLFSVNDFKKKYTPEFIINNVIPELFNGIKRLHELKIYHCDLKPSNIFYKDENQTDLLIGDYGSAKASDIEEENLVRITSTIKGTEFYIAPEQKDGIVSDKNDFYSMGMILLHLMYPDEVCIENNFSRIDKKKSDTIKIRQHQSKKIIEFNDSYGRLNNIIEGLTLNNPELRWSKAEVQKWINGENITVKYSNEVTTIQPISLGKSRLIKSEIDLISFLETQSDWRSELIDDETSKKEFFRWIDNIRGKDDRERVKNIIIYYTDEDANIKKKFREEFNISYTKEALLRYFNPKKEIRLESKVFSLFNLKNINSDIELFIGILDNIWKITPIDKIRFSLFQLEFSLRQLYDDKRLNNENKYLVKCIIDKLYGSLGLQPQQDLSFSDYKTQIQGKINPQNIKTANEFLLKVFYTFNSARTFRDKENNSLKTITDIGLYLAKNENMYDDIHIVTEKQKYFSDNNFTNLKSLDYRTFIFEVFKGEAVSEIELSDLSIDKNRNFTIYYKYFKSLNSYLSKNGINRDFTSRSDEDLIFNHTKGFLVPVKNECSYFINTVCENHNISNLSNENITEVSNRFSSLYWRKHFVVYFGQYLAFILLIPMLILFFMFFNHNMSIGSDLKLFFPNGQYASADVSKYIVTTNSNLRSEPTINSTSVNVIPQNSEIQVLSKGYYDNRSVEWYKVNYNGSEGYLNSALCTQLSLTSNNIIVNPNDFAGRYIITDWYKVDDNSRYNSTGSTSFVFNKDGTGSFYKEGKDNYLSWNITSNNLLYLYFSDNQEVWEITKWGWSKKGIEMINHNGNLRISMKERGFFE